MYEFWCDYVKLNKVITNTGDIYKEIANDVETRFDTSSYELESSLLKWKSKNVIGFMKDELGRKTMKEFVALGAKTYSYLIDDGSEN